jgi:hypothetical protein
MSFYRKNTHLIYLLGLLLVFVGILSIASLQVQKQSAVLTSTNLDELPTRELLSRVIDLHKTTVTTTDALLISGAVPGRRGTMLEITTK